MVSEMASEILEITINRGSNGFGICIKGGKDQPEYISDDGVFISGVKNTAINDNFKKGDKVLELNGRSVTGLTHEEVVTMFSRAPDVSKVKIQQGASKNLDTSITRSIDKDGEVSLMVQKELGMPITWKQRPAVQRDVFPRREDGEVDEMDERMAARLLELQRRRHEQGGGAFGEFV